MGCSSFEGPFRRPCLKELKLENDPTMSLKQEGPMVAQVSLSGFFKKDPKQGPLTKKPETVFKKDRSAFKQPLNYILKGYGFL